MTACGSRLTEPVLEIDLEAVAANWRAFQRIAPGRETAAVVKADAYGLGLDPVARRLAAAGARTFFIATAREGEALRRAVPAAVIYVLNGLLPGEAGRLLAAELRPVLQSPEAIDVWRAQGAGGPCAVQADVGMNRLGLSALDGAAIAGLDVRLLIGHLACADAPGHPANAEALARFRAIRARLPALPASLAASAGALMGADYQFDMIRPGIGLYGGHPLAEGHSPFRATVRLLAPILQVRRVDKGETVGYGATLHIAGPRRLATVAVGYADGVMRSSSSRGSAAVGGHPAPFAGRVSMDLLTLDVTDVPEALTAPGLPVELIGPHRTIDQVAAGAGTLAYEILTRLGARLQRRYLPAGEIV